MQVIKSEASTDCLHYHSATRPTEVGSGAWLDCLHCMLRADGLRVKPRHRGRRGALQELSRLPKWGRDLLHQLRELPCIHRTYIIKTLRWIADFLESEWFGEQLSKEQVIDDGINGDAPAASSSSASVDTRKRKRDGTDAPNDAKRRNVHVAWNDL